METKISDFHTIFYIPSIQKLAFHLPHVCMLGTNQCGEMRRTAFKQRELFQDVIFRCDYAESVGLPWKSDGRHQINLKIYTPEKS